MSQESKLIKNTAIYSIGSLSSKILAYVMVLVYSRYIMPESMGYYDVVMTTISLIYPVVTLELVEGIYRFVIDPAGVKREVVIATSYKVILINTLVTEGIFIIFAYFFQIKFLTAIVGYSVSYVFYEVTHTTIRAFAENKVYTVVGIANSFIILICEVVGVVILQGGIGALWVSMAVANIACSIYAMIKYRLMQILKDNKIDKNVFRALNNYSLPTVPSTICWWVVNSCDRYIVLGFLGQLYNGIYAMAAKFPTILNVLTSGFYISWQESAIKEYNSDTRDVFFTRTYKSYCAILFSGCLVLIPATKIVILYLMGSTYESAWMYTGGLFIGAVYSALSSFLGLGYQISKQTERSLISTVLAAVINIVVNIGLVKLIGLHAASISTAVAYFFLFIIRVIDTKRYFHIAYDWKTLVLLPGVSVLMSVLCILNGYWWIDFLLCFGAVIFSVVLNKEIIIILVNKIIGGVKKSFD